MSKEKPNLSDKYSELNVSEDDNKSDYRNSATEELPVETANLNNESDEMLQLPASEDDLEMEPSGPSEDPPSDYQVLSTSSSDEETTLNDELKNWAGGNQVKMNHTDELLKILRRFGHSELPATARTLMGTNTYDVPIEYVSGYETYYYDIHEEFNKHLSIYKNGELDNIACLKIQLNYDGVPIFKRNTSSIWPLLCTLCNLPGSNVFPIMLSYGESAHPTNNDLLIPVITDLKKLFENGFFFNEKQYQVELNAIICDAPARSMAKCVKGHSGYFACDRCTQEGEYIEHRVVLPETRNLHMRTDHSFRTQEQRGHHNDVSPFLELEIDMISVW
jgi:hypothetical protein